MQPQELKNPALGGKSQKAKRREKNKEKDMSEVGPHERGGRTHQYHDLTYLR